MLETKIKLLEDRPDRIAITEIIRPWQWGGPAFSPVQIVLVLLFPVMLILKGSRKVVFDRAYQSVTIDCGILFLRQRKQVQFAAVGNILLPLREVTRVVTGGSPSHQGMGDIGLPVTLDLGDLSLSLLDKSKLKIATAYWSDKKIRSIGKKIGELIEKPFLVSGNGELIHQ